MNLVARFLNGPHAGQDIAVNKVMLILEVVMHQRLICDITEPLEPIGPAPEIAQYRFVGSSGDVLYYTLNREITHAMEDRWGYSWNEAPPEIYRQAQLNPWPGESYDGTSIMEVIREQFQNHPAFRPTPAWLEGARVDAQEYFMRRGHAPPISRRDPEATSPDSMVVRFSEMSKEAEAEMDAWEDLLHG